MPTSAPPPPLLSAVIPVYNEESNIPALLARLTRVLDALHEPAEIIFVDDGSRDNSAKAVLAAAARDARVRLVQLSRNFGHQAALVAGLEQARGRAVITLDGDLQHPPELIPAMVSYWREGYEVVQTIRREFVDDRLLKRIASRWFYRALGAVTWLALTPGAADFRLMDRVAVDAFLACQERCRCNRALVQWIGFSYRELMYDAEPRLSGRSKYSYGAMLRLGADAVFSFSSMPLRLAGLLGAVVSAGAGLYLLFVLWARLFTDLTQPGWTSVLAAVLVLGGVNLLVIWILGEYVGRIYEEVKKRPIYVARPCGPRTDPSEPRTDSCGAPTDVHSGYAPPAAGASSVASNDLAKSGSP